MNSDAQAPALATDFDERGVPQSLAVARAMTHDQLVAVVRAVVADMQAVEEEALDEYPVSAIDGSPEIASELGVWVFTEITAHLSAQPVPVTHLDERQWSSIDGLAHILGIAIARIKK